MPRHHDLTGPVPRFSGIHPYLNSPFPDWKPKHPKLFDTYLDIQVGDTVVTGYPNFDEPGARLIYCEVLEIGPIKWGPERHLHPGEDPRNWPIQVRLKPLPGQGWNREAHLYEQWPQQMSLEWVRGVVRQSERDGLPLPLD
jgi:hypothetical protein